MRDKNPSLGVKNKKWCSQARCKKRASQSKLASLKLWIDEKTTFLDQRNTSIIQSLDATSSMWPTALLDPPYWNTFGPNREHPGCRRGIEQISLCNFTLLTIRHIKEWFSGGFTPLSSGISDFSFMRLLFACLMTPNFQSLEGDIGHSWSPSRSKFKEHNLSKTAP